MKEPAFLKIVTVVSVLVPVIIGLIFWLPHPESEGTRWMYDLPLFHACLNGSSFCILLLGYYFILNKKILLHRTCMLTAAGLTAVFLVSYLVYHSNVPQTMYGGEGFSRYFYFSILVSHIVLAATIVPMVLITLYRGLSNKVASHRKIARRTLPLWLYVALTGVVVYLMMRPYYPA